MPLWNLALTGYPSSGKTFVARILVQDKIDFVRITGDDVRTTFFNKKMPSRVEDLICSTPALVRHEFLRQHYNVVIDATAPTFKFGNDDLEVRYELLRAHRTA